MKTKQPSDFHRFSEFPHMLVFIEIPANLLFWQLLCGVSARATPNLPLAQLLLPPKLQNPQNVKSTLFQFSAI